MHILSYTLWFENKNGQCKYNLERPLTHNSKASRQRGWFVAFFKSTLFILKSSCRINMFEKNALITTYAGWNQFRSFAWETTDKKLKTLYFDS